MTTTRTDSAARAGGRAFAATLAVPPIALALFTVLSLVLAPFGYHPLWRISDANMSEAAVTRDAATVMRLITERDDPNAPRFVRPGLMQRGAARATSLEAALSEKRLEIVDILLRHGATLDEAKRTEFICAARGRGDTDIERYFEARGGPVTCEDAR